MRTTLDLDVELLRRARERASEQRTTLSAVVERALRETLLRDAPDRIVLPTGRFPVPPGLNLSDNAAVLDYIEANEAIRGPS